MYPLLSDSHRVLDRIITVVFGVFLMIEPIRIATVSVYTHLHDVVKGVWK